MSRMSSDDATTHRVFSRKLTWYSLTAMSLVALVALSRERRFMAKYRDAQSSVVDANVPGASKPQPIRQISIIGERNSGTRWTFRYFLLTIMTAFARKFQIDKFCSPRSGFDAPP